MKIAKRGAAIGAVAMATALAVSPAAARGNREQDPSPGIPGPDFIQVLYIATLDGKEIAVGTNLVDAIPCVYKGAEGTMKKIGDLLFCGGRVVLPIGDWDYRINVELYRPLKDGSSYTVKIEPGDPARTRYSGNYKSQEKPQAFMVRLRENFSEAELWANPAKDIYGYPLKTEIKIGSAMRGEIRLLIVPSDNYVGKRGEPGFLRVYSQHRDRQYFAEMLP